MRIALALLMLTTPVLAEGAPAGFFAADNKQDLPAILLSAGQPLGADWYLTSGRYYQVEISADGSQELSLSGAGFFRAIRIDEVTVDGIEIHPLGLDSLGFDDEGSLELGFIAIRPGRYTLGTVQGGETQTLTVIIE